MKRARKNDVKRALALAFVDQHVTRRRTQKAAETGQERTMLLAQAGEEADCRQFGRSGKLGHRVRRLEGCGDAAGARRRIRNSLAEPQARAKRIRENRIAAGTRA